MRQTSLRLTNLLSSLSLWVLVVLTLPSALNAETESDTNTPEQNKSVPVLVKFSDDTKAADQKAKKLSKKYDAKVKFVYRNTIKGANLKVPQRHLSTFMSRKSVTLLTQERRMQILGEPSIQSDAVQMSDLMKGKEMWTRGMKRINADQVSNRESHKDVNVAVIDTGIDSDHPDLRNNVKGGANFIQKGGSDGWKRDAHRHGTHVAGTIAAEMNGDGLIGVAPNANLFSVRVMNPRGKGGNSGAIVKGVDWVADPANDIDVANMSLGGPALARLIGMDTMGKAVKRAVDKGIAFSVAAGNSGKPLEMYTPAGYEEVTTVSAIDPENDAFAEFSNYGVTAPTVAAPGVRVVSTVPKRAGRMGMGYGAMDGTSMAAPHVAGAMALLLGKNPGLSPSEVEKGLRNEGMSVEWKETPFLSGFSGGNPPLINAEEMANGIDQKQNQQSSGKSKQDGLLGSFFGTQ